MSAGTRTIDNIRGDVSMAVDQTAVFFGSYHIRSILIVLLKSGRTHSKILGTVLWILNTGAQWHMPPQRYPSYKTVH